MGATFILGLTLTAVLVIGFFSAIYYATSTQCVLVGQPFSLETQKVPLNQFLSNLTVYVGSGYKAVVNYAMHTVQLLQINATLQIVGSQNQSSNHLTAKTAAQRIQLKLTRC
jgi:hypothetical protein